MFGKTFLSTHAGAGSGLGRLAVELAMSVAGFARALRHRREVMRLAELDDRTLKDIGLLRSDVAGALGEPYATDPSRILVIRRHERRPITRSKCRNPAPSPVPRIPAR